MLLVLDNYDSFTYNLVHIFRELGVPLEVHRNDALGVEEVARYDAVVLSPGPGIPEEAGILHAVVRRYGAEKPILGVCLGHQGIGEVYGAQLINLPEVLHGVATPMQVLNGGDPLFEGLPDRFSVARYHSWSVSGEGLPDCLQVISQDDEGQILALRHREHPVYGVQFHPESVITEYGIPLIQNWLATTSLSFSR